jgi:peptidoglycan/LPS O-acetylase OafA/YrhL
MSKQAAWAAVSPSRSIPSLDGLRAISIALVMLAHSGWYLPLSLQRSSVFQAVVGNGAHGVAFFFVISGYLITALLSGETGKYGTVCLRRFYFRRSLRIFPPFYVFLLALLILWKLGIILEHSPSFIAAATYTWAYYPRAQGYFITHSWSLSVEEQFYLLWPLTFLIWHRRTKLIAVALFLIFAMPLVRVSLYFVAPALRGHESYMVQGWVDTMMVGCLLALLEKKPGWVEWRQRYLNGWVASLSIVTALFVVPMVSSSLPKRLGGLMSLAVWPTITAIGIAGAMIYVVTHPDSGAGKLLNNRVVRHVGIISYSLYLWQQIFMAQEFHLLPYGYFYAFLAAQLSFWLVETPSLRLRERLAAVR